MKTRKGRGEWVRVDRRNCHRGLLEKMSSRPKRAPSQAEGDGEWKGPLDEM